MKSMTTTTGAGGRNEFLRSSKIISRQSSVSFSSRIYYRSSGAAGFPFNWEMLPGEPKQKPAKDGDILPLSPPPALHSLSLPKPSVENHLDTKKSPSLQSKLFLMKLWKKMSAKMKKRQSRFSLAHRIKSLDMSNENQDSDVEVTMEDFGFWRSASCSPLHSSSSSSSMTEDHNSNAAGEVQDVNGTKPSARGSWSVRKMVTACASGTKWV